MKDENDIEYISQLSQQQNAPEFAPPHRQKSKIGRGILIGLLIGILLTACCLTVGLRFYLGATGKMLVLGGSGEQSDGAQMLDQSTAVKMQEIVSYINTYYTGEYTADKLKDGLLHGIVQSLGDPYSVYYNPEEYQQLQVSTTGNYAGIGAGLTQDVKTMEVTVTKVYAGTPAEAAGLKNGDKILKVGDIEATSMELSDLVLRIRGEEGTTVHLKLYRTAENRELELDVERKNIELPSVEYSMLPENTGYIQISQFQTDTAEQFQKALDELKAQGMEKMIVDLRDNPGGLLDSVVAILDTILPEGTVVYTEDKQGERKDYTSDANKLDYPLAVLVNGNSASASEIFAGAIKDYQYGTLIGTKTFGKGIVQSIFPMSDGAGLKITTANYYTPKGNFIHGVGIEPDVELEYQFQGAEGEPYAQEYDNQLLYAQEYLKTY